MMVICNGVMNCGLSLSDKSVEQVLRCSVFQGGRGMGGRDGWHGALQVGVMIFELMDGMSSRVASLGWLSDRLCAVVDRYTEFVDALDARVVNVMPLHHVLLVLPVVSVRHRHVLLLSL